MEALGVSPLRDARGREGEARTHILLGDTKSNIHHDTGRSRDGMVLQRFPAFYPC